MVTSQGPGESSKELTFPSEGEWAPRLIFKGISNDHDASGYEMQYIPNGGRCNGGRCKFCFPRGPDDRWIQCITASAISECYPFCT